MKSVLCSLFLLALSLGVVEGDNTCVNCKLPKRCVQCWVNPCDVKSCRIGGQKADCKPDYCGGCNAKFNLYGIDVTSLCKQIAQSG